MGRPLRGAARLAAGVGLLLAVGLLFIGVAALVAAPLTLAHLSPKASGMVGVIVAAGVSTPVARRVGRQLARLAGQPRPPSAAEVDMTVPRDVPRS